MTRRLSAGGASPITPAMRIVLALAATLAPLLLAAGCASRPAPRPVPPRPVVIAPHPVPTPLPVPQGSDWRDWAVTPGDWAYRVDARGSIALFGTPGADAAVTLRCDLSAGALYFSRAGTLATPVTVRTSSMARTLAVQPTGATPPYVAVTIAPRDALLDAIAFSRGRFVVEQSGAPTLVVPAWAEIGRVIEDCRG